MRRKERETSETAALKIADSCQWGILSMITPEGAPYCLPLNLVRDGQNFYFHSATAGQKLDCLRLNPRVCLSFVGTAQVVGRSFTTRYRSAVVRGWAREVTDRQEMCRALELLCRRLAADDMDAFPRELDNCLSAVAVWKIRMDTITGKSNWEERI